MKKKSNLKFYFHHASFVTLKGGKKSFFWGLFKIPAVFIFNFLFFIGNFFLTLLAVLKKYISKLFISIKKVFSWPFKKIFYSVRADFSSSAKSIPERLKLFFSIRFAKTLMLFLTVSAIGYGGIFSLHLIAAGLGIKDSVMQTSLLGNKYLDEAKNALASQDFSTADNRFALAFRSFNQGQQELESSGRIFNQLLSVIPQKQAADGLLEAASLIASAGQDFIGLQNDLKSLRITAAGVGTESGKAEEILVKIDSQAAKISEKVGRANALVAKINSGSLPAASRERFLDLQSKLQVGRFALENFTEVFHLATSLLVGDKNVLLLFENNNELRAGGGFVGTFGILKIHGGKISNINVSSIYDLDNQLKENIQPPLPILQVSQSWFMRDSNWFSDFPLSAKKISSFYEREGGETPDLVIAMTPNLISGLLEVTGPINLPGYGLTLNSENFVEETQAVTTLSNNLPTNAPKQILADLVPILLQKISELPSSGWPEVIQKLQNNLNNKQIVLYSRDQDLENMFKEFHWAGNVQETDRDYLSVVSSNLGATKTDLFIDQKVDLSTSVKDDGSIVNTVTITRTNKMPNLANGFNDSFLRIYAPLGSKLISNLGFDFKTLEYSPLNKYTHDSDVEEWQKHLVKDVVSGTYIGEESGKTFFGNWLSLKGGETRTITLAYQLPFKIQNLDKYSLLLQKQIGSSNSKFSWAVDFEGRKIAWKNFDAPTLNTNSLNFDTILDKDNFFGMVLQKR